LDLAGELAEARALFARALQIFRDLGDRDRSAEVLAGLAAAGASRAGPRAWSVRSRPSGAGSAYRWPLRIARASSFTRTNRAKLSVPRGSSRPKTRVAR